MSKKTVYFCCGWSFMSLPQCHRSEYEGWTASDGEAVVMSHEADLSTTSSQAYHLTWAQKPLKQHVNWVQVCGHDAHSVICLPSRKDWEEELALLSRPPPHKAQQHTCMLPSAGDQLEICTAAAPICAHPKRTKLQIPSSC